MDVRKEEFFMAVEEKSLDKLKDILNQDGMEETAALAKSFNEYNETPLLTAISTNQKEMVKFLIDTLRAPIDQIGDIWWDSTDDDYHEQGPPLFCAIICNEDLSIVKFLIDKEMSNTTVEHPVLNSVLTSSIDRLQKIMILELIGATYILERPELERAKKTGLLCWIEALLLREQQPGVAAVLKTPGNLANLSQQIFGTASEFTTFQELTEMVSHAQFDLIEMQALFVVERIYSEYGITLGPNYVNQIKDIWYTFF